MSYVATWISLVVGNAIAHATMNEAGFNLERWILASWFFGLALFTHAVFTKIVK
jgi:hypothetical protein